MTGSSDEKQLLDRVASLVEAAKKAGADAADAVVIRSRSRNVSVRLGKVEGTESSESDDMSLRVFVGQRVASVSATTASDPASLAVRAVAMARVSPEDAFAGLADPDKLARRFADLDLVDPTEVSPDRLRDDALAAEEVALAVPGVTNSSGAGASAGSGGLVLATSQGFVGQYAATRFSRSVSVIAGEGTGMERDYDFSSRLHFADLDTPEKIGRTAGERAARRLGARKVPTGRYPVIYDSRVARGIAGHIAGAINGASVARKTSFLRDRMGKQIASADITITDDPTRVRGQASRPFDGEGVAGVPIVPVRNGVLEAWLLSSSVGRELGLETNGRGARASSSVNPSSTNFAIEPGETDRDDLISGIKAGLYVTEVFGQGVNMITGEYSRGAAGFWIENGVIAHPVSEITIAGNMKDMFLNMTPASDLDRNYGTAAPTLLIEGMTIAGE
ncbi:TldD/PmbA family protein [Nitratireductor luteus]|uniref:TldD/PmbA family protein n=1 Tax=Nitratireductor luteus TaxID=2976980 RepID=UPI00223FCADC|nr:TldD/PmbA family protein [Nitratireductor luteus]